MTHGIESFVLLFKKDVHWYSIEKVSNAGKFSSLYLSKISVCKFQNIINNLFQKFELFGLNLYQSGLFHLIYERTKLYNFPFKWLVSQKFFVVVRLLQLYHDTKPVLHSKLFTTVIQIFLEFTFEKILELRSSLIEYTYKDLCFIQ